MSSSIYKFKTLKTPVGVLKLIANEKGLAGILWENEDPKWFRLESKILDEQHPILMKTEKQLKEFFEGKRMVFDLPLDFKGTDFQKAVWSELLKTPFGQLRSYGEIAKAIGNPKAVRAVGAANGKNPIPIICPCHRIIGADGSLTGFAGGLKMKEILLSLENHEIDDSKKIKVG